MNAALGRVIQPVPSSQLTGVHESPAALAGKLRSIDSAAAKDYMAVPEALGKVIASGPSGQVTDVYVSFAKLVARILRLSEASLWPYISIHSLCVPAPNRTMFSS